MKYRFISVIAVVLVLATVLVANVVQPKKNRYHQHLEEEPYTPCEDHGDEQFCTHLPLFNIITDEPMPDPFLYDESGQPLLNEANRLVANNEMVGATVQFFNNPDGNNHLTDVPDVSERGLIRVRGNSSRHFDKKNYLLKFTEANGVDALNVSLDGMTADSSWILHGPILDKTMLRNYLCYNIMGEVMDYVPEVRFCELFLNGEYEGVYVIIEKVKQNDDGRVNITKTDPDMAATSFIISIDKGDADEFHNLETFLDYTGIRGLSTRHFSHLEIIYPSDTLTQEQKDYIEHEISSLEKAMTSFDSSDSRRGYPAYLDIDSFVDFFVFNEFMMNVDAGNLSTYLCKDIRGKIKILSCDYNNAFNNYTTDLEDRQAFCLSVDWYDFLMRDERFVDKVVDRYNELRKTVLSDEYLKNYIEETIEYLGPAIERNYERWGYTFDVQYNIDNSDVVLLPLNRNASNYDEAVDQLLATIQKRGSFLDENIGILYARCHESANKKFKIPGA